LTILSAMVKSLTGEVSDTCKPIKILKE
jgi:hypothetical protein